MLPDAFGNFPIMAGFALNNRAYRFPAKEHVKGVTRLVFVEEAIVPAAISPSSKRMSGPARPRKP